jgi:hypothetical protein
LGYAVLLAEPIEVSARAVIAAASAIAMRFIAHESRAVASIGHCRIVTPDLNDRVERS